MKTKLLLSILLFYAASALSQNPNSTFLTWMKGDNTINQGGLYGTPGVSTATNKPGARDFSATWKDNNGNLWLFGGFGYDTDNLGYLNDLWKFNPSNNQWTWVKGDNIIEQYATYGSQGQPHENNKPGSIYASISWTDKNGNLWLFGGFGYTDAEFGFLHDLWKFNPSTNKWTWVNGDKLIDQPGIYGTKGSPAPANKPGARYGSRTWTDNNGDLWLFGGYGFDQNSATGSLNDLWKYNTTTNQWTWISGDDIVDQYGVYGSPGVSSATNKPGGRYVSVSWTDSNNDLWLFGGSGYDGTKQGNLNDLWKYNISTNQWTWVKGDSQVNRPGVYGTQCEPQDYTCPGARYVSVSWTDAMGDLWLFGGYGYDTGVEGYLNDLWKYDPDTNQWTWVKGDSQVDQPGIYGTLGMPSLQNKSGARTSCVSWTGVNGELWLFGGFGYDAISSGILNDLWKISSITSPLALQFFRFSGTLSNDVARLKWQAAQEQDFRYFGVQRSFNGTHFTEISRMSSPGIPFTGEFKYDDNDLVGRQDKKVFYRLELIDKDGRISYSKAIRFDLGAPLLSLNIFPNPAVNTLNLSFDQSTPGIVCITVTDVTGKRLLNQSESHPGGRISTNIDISALPAATHILSVTNSSGTITRKFVKQ